MADTTVRTTGPGFAGWLTILFVGLKLTGYIDWSWWLVLSPLLISAGVVLLIAAVALALIVFVD